MQQHPIPQNILDFEFKLFSKFTVREFVYMAIGIGFGAIFLVLFSQENLPGLIAIPLFAVFAGGGLFLGLVPINDQKADVYLRNFITAITNPTLRSWRNKKSTSKYQSSADSINLPYTKGNMDRLSAQNKPGSPLIGGTNFSKQVVVDDGQKNEQTAQQTRARHQPQSIPTITIGAHNIEQFKVAVSDPNYEPNGIVFLVIDKNGGPIPNAIAIVKTQQNKAIQTQKSNKSGWVESIKTLPNDTYHIEIQHKNYTFPKIIYILDNDIEQPFKVTALT